MNWGGTTRYETVQVNQVLRGALLDDPDDVGGNAVSLAPARRTVPQTGLFEGRRPPLVGSGREQQPNP